MTDRHIAGLPIRVAVLYLALTAGGFLFYGFAWRAAPAIDGDSSQYMEVAQDLRDFRIDSLHDRSPGYPALIALAGATERPSRQLFYVSLLLHFASVWLLALTLHAAGVAPNRLVWFGILLTLPPFVEPAGYVMTENLAQFTLTAGVAGLIRWFSARSRTWLAVATISLAYAGLTRPVFQLLGLGLAAGLVFVPGLTGRLGLARRDAMSAASSLVVGALVILGSYAAFNESAFGFFGVAPTSGLHLSTKTMGFVERLPDEYSTARDILARERDALLTQPGGRHDGTQTIWHARQALSQALFMNTPELSSYLLRMNLRLISQSPLEYLQEVGRAFSAYWFPATGPLATFNSSLLRWLWALIHLAVLLTFIWQAIVITGGSAAGVQTWKRTITAIAYLLCAAVVIYTMLLSCFLDIGEPRQRRPTDALIVAMCFVGARRTRGYLPPRSR